MHLSGEIDGAEVSRENQPLEGEHRCLHRLNMKWLSRMATRSRSHSDNERKQNAEESQWSDCDGILRVAKQDWYPS